jgi:hypothetical protein
LTKRKGDLIDAVKNGAKIEIREGKVSREEWKEKHLPSNELANHNLLKEGDQIGDTKTRDALGETGTVIRIAEFVGKPATKYKFFGLFTLLPITCKYCGTHMHWINVVKTRERKGRDKGTHVLTSSSETTRIICPNCEYISDTYDYSF